MEFRKIVLMNLFAGKGHADAGNRLVDMGRGGRGGDEWRE